MKRWLTLGLCLLVLGPGSVRAQTGSNAPLDEWELALSPFLWAAGMDGTVGVANREREFDVSAKDLIESLDFAVATNFEAGRAGGHSASTSSIRTWART